MLGYLRLGIFLLFVCFVAWATSGIRLNEDQAVIFAIGLGGLAIVLLLSMRRSHLLQGVTFFSVMCANIYFDLTSSWSLACLIAIVATFLVTLAVKKIAALVTARRAMPTTRRQ